MYPNINSNIGQIMAQSMTDATSGDLNSTGRIFIVCSSTDVNVSEIKAMYGSGYPDGTPIIYTTLTLALAKCIADRGDVIFIVPGHVETITAAAGVNVNVAGVRIIGLGTGTDRATFNFTIAVAASFNIVSANVWLQNILFTVGFDAITAMINVTATDCTFSNCEIDTNNATMGVVLGILLGATADRFVFMNGRCVGPAVNTGTTTTAQIQYESAVDIQIINSYFTGKMTQSILNVTGTVLRGLIQNNTFVVATGTKAISVAAASTPMIVNNRINVPSGSTPIIAAAGFVAGNVYSAAAGVTAVAVTQ